MLRPLLLVALLLVAAGCLQQPGAEPTPTPPTITHAVTPTPPSPTPGDTNIDDADALVAANARFAMDAFQVLSAAASGENLVVSPYSISTALEMVYGGADGTTRADIAEALRLGSAEPTLDAQARALLLNLTTTDPNVTLRIGDSLWIDQGFASEINLSFPARVQHSYQAEAFFTDFADPQTVDDVNAWASNKTEGKIPKVIDAIADDEVMLLLNAVYFKGAWTERFNTTCTHDAPFTRDDGQQVTVSMMCGAKGHTYAQDASRTIVRMPYGDGRFAMYAILPQNGTKLDAFVASWDGDLTGVTGSPAILQMPRLKLATKTLDLEPSLTDLGMGLAFSDQADFTRIAQNLYLSRVIHDAILEVDEEGTVAAAVTTIGVGVTSYTPPLNVTLDRPFLLVIKDDASGTLLFTAKVHDPSVA